MKLFENIEAVAFDLDGTLVDSLADLCTAANRAREHFGMPALPEKTVASFIGDGVGELTRRSLAGDRNGHVDEALWAQGLAFFIDYYRRHLTVKTRPYPGVIETLVLLKKARLPMAVVTNKSEVLAVELLKQLDMDQYFSLILGGDTLPEKKPLPLPVIHAAEVLGVPSEQLLMVGDTANDIDAANAAGSPVCGVSYGFGDMEALSQRETRKPDAVIAEFSELAGLLDISRRLPR